MNTQEKLSNIYLDIIMLDAKEMGGDEKDTLDKAAELIDQLIERPQGNE